ncbi:hypothetical protein EDEG_01847 [Edhazardia aedis USNM 41457]|uniref:Uncharacterized protein n=1 Tax=Edhazardia aedis (strain USNM 41457) TaxID=1003232 RepID=J8ZVZ6_EDHAE|nr:hypothetical protein EDEG_01847 [Edhazardia aedis USNM 41457]|eukprot:EJW03848.1 hypothetical protein EDEG_01847 [Edhazardia aedis USNM 41457]
MHNKINKLQENNNKKNSERYKYAIPYCCPILSPRLCLASYLCPCYISSKIFNKLFESKQLISNDSERIGKGRGNSWFGFLCIPFAAYGIRRFVIEKIDANESAEVSALKSCCYCNSLTQDVNEMDVRKIGAYKFDNEPDLDSDSSSIV